MRQGQRIPARMLVSPVFSICDSRRLDDDQRRRRNQPYPGGIAER